MTGRRARPRTKRGGLIACLVHCVDCGWEYEGRNGMGLGAQHAGLYEHEVQVESSYAMIFNEKNR